MAYEEYWLRKSDPELENELDLKFKQFLTANLSEDSARKLYSIGIDTITILAIIGVFLSLPIKFLQFFRQSWINQKNNNKPIQIT